MIRTWILSHGHTAVRRANHSATETCQRLLLLLSAFMSHLSSAIWWTALWLRPSTFSCNICSDGLTARKLLAGSSGSSLAQWPRSDLWIWSVLNGNWMLCYSLQSLSRTLHLLTLLFGWEKRLLPIKRSQPLVPKRSLLEKVEENQSRPTNSGLPVKRPLKWS